MSIRSIRTVHGLVCVDRGHGNLRSNFAGDRSDLESHFREPRNPRSRSWGVPRSNRNCRPGIETGGHRSSVRKQLIDSFHGVVAATVFFSSGQVPVSLRECILQKYDQLAVWGSTSEKTAASGYASEILLRIFLVRYQHLPLPKIPRTYSDPWILRSGAGSTLGARRVSAQNRGIFGLRV